MLVAVPDQLGSGMVVEWGCEQEPGPACQTASNGRKSQISHQFKTSRKEQSGPP